VSRDIILFASLLYYSPLSRTWAVRTGHVRPVNYRSPYGAMWLNMPRVHARSGIASRRHSIVNDCGGVGSTRYENLHSRHTAATDRYNSRTMYTLVTNTHSTDKTTDKHGQ